MLYQYEFEPCFSCTGNTGSDSFGPNCLACRHSYSKGSEAYERKHDYYQRKELAHASDTNHQNSQADVPERKVSGENQA